jgi:hypothetical protein
MHQLSLKSQRCQQLNRQRKVLCTQQQWKANTKSSSRWQMNGKSSTAHIYSQPAALCGITPNMWSEASPCVVAQVGIPCSKLVWACAARAARG